VHCLSEEGLGAIGGRGKRKGPDSDEEEGGLLRRSGKGV